MKFKKLVTLVVLSIVVCTSCKNSLNIQAPYKDITVVYGLLDQNDPIHYIRINKAFEGNGNAYTMAQQYDSIYYPVSAITAVLEDSNPTTDAIVKIIPLDTTTAISLNPGTFSYPKQLLYYTNQTLNTNDYYNLVVTNAKTGKKMRGSTPLLQDVNFQGNIAQQHVNLALGSNPYPTLIQWYSSSTALIYQMTILFYYDNQVDSGPRVSQTPLQLVFAQETPASTSGGAQMSYSVSCQQLFSLIAYSIPYELGVTRHADSLVVVFTTGTNDLNTYIQLSQPPTGINQDVPSFTDVSNGIGLFTARHIQTFNKTIDKNTLDSIEGTSQEPRFNLLGFRTPQ